MTKLYGEELPDEFFQRLPEGFFGKGDDEFLPLQPESIGIKTSSVVVNRSDLYDVKGFFDDWKEAVISVNNAGRAYTIMDKEEYHRQLERFKKTKRKPDLAVYYEKPGKRGEKDLVKFGAGWRHNKGNGMSIQLVDGAKYVIFPNDQD